MVKKKSFKITLKEMLLSFLAISKVMYYSNFVFSIDHANLGSMGTALLSRILTNDMLIIIGVILFFVLDGFIQRKLEKDKIEKSKRRIILEAIVFYVIFYIIMMSIVYLYIWVLSLFFGGVSLDWIAGIVYSLFAYVAAIVVLNAKEYFKKKTATEYVPSGKSVNEKIELLEILCKEGVLTPDEFEEKKSGLLGA